MYTHIHDFDDRYNRLQFLCKMLMSSWLLGMFLAIGFVLSREFDLPVPEMFIIALIAGLTCAGVFTLGRQDKIYQDLFAPTFNQAIRLEKQYRWLPQIRMAMDLKGRNVRYAVTQIYDIVAIVLLLITIATIILGIESMRVTCSIGANHM